MMSRFRAWIAGLEPLEFYPATFLLCLVVVMACVLSGCQTLPQPPKVATKIVTEYRALPSWATAEVANDPPVNQSVKAITESNNRRGETIDAVNCRSRLLEKLGKGEAVSPKECKP